MQTLVLQGQWQQDSPGTLLLSLSPRFTFLTAKLQIAQTSLIPPLPPILVNESTQELVSIRCLSNNLVPDPSAITCLSVNEVYFLSVQTCFCFFLKRLCIKIYFIFQVCVLCNGGHSSCSYLVHSDHQVAAKPRGQAVSRV